eukprot:jgi/Botrbrau1/20819/Bobra.0156s0046.1
MIKVPMELLWVGSGQNNLRRKGSVAGVSHTHLLHRSPRANQLLARSSSFQGKQRRDLEIGKLVRFSREFELLCNDQYKLLSYVLGSNVNAEFFARTPDSFRVNDLTFQRIPRCATEGTREHDQLTVRLDKASGNPEDALHRVGKKIMELGDAYAVPVWFPLEGREDERNLHSGPASWPEGLTIVPRYMKHDYERPCLTGLLIIEGYAGPPSIHEEYHKIEPVAHALSLSYAMELRVLKGRQALKLLTEVQIPLTTIRSFGNKLLEKTQKAHPAHDMVQAVNQQAALLQEIVHQLQAALQKTSAVREGVPAGRTDGLQYAPAHLSSGSRASRDGHGRYMLPSRPDDAHDATTVVEV